MSLTRFLPRIVVSAACALLIAGCAGTSTGPSSSAPFSQVDLRVGTGTEAVSLTTLTVNYTGWLYDPARPDLKGLQFDTSLGKDPFTFQLGVKQVIAGWDQGLIGMKVGGIRRLVVPSVLAYGGVRNSSIPPYATLVFEIELLGVQ